MERWRLNLGKCRKVFVVRRNSGIPAEATESSPACPQASRQTARLFWESSTGSSLPSQTPSLGTCCPARCSRSSSARSPLSLPLGLVAIFRGRSPCPVLRLPVPCAQFQRAVRNPNIAAACSTPEARAAQDLLVASLFRNFLLAERIMRATNCSPVSYPQLPPTHQHPMWQVTKQHPRHPGIASLAPPPSSLACFTAALSLATPLVCLFGGSH